MRVRLRAIYRFTIDTKDRGMFSWIARLLTELHTLIRRVDPDATLHIQDEELNTNHKKED